ncbi:MAG: phage portal protein [Flavobacteriaceae bacterium]
MGLIDNIREFLTPAQQPQDIKKVAMNIQTGTVRTDNYAYMTAWYFNPQIGQPRGGTPITTMRQFAQTPQVSMAIKTIIDEVTGMEWEIVPKKGYEDTYNPQIMDEIVEFLQYPNRNGESFQDILKMLLKDILEIDAGVLVKVFAGDSKTEKNYTYTSFTDSTITTDIKVKALTKNAKMTEIYCRDGGSFIVAPDMYGILPDDRPSYFQYSFLNANLEPKPFWKREISYYKMNPRSTTPYGWSPIESIFMILEALNNAVRFNKKIFEEHAIPDGALSIIGADEEALGRFIESWKQNVKGKPHKLVIFNEDMKFTPFQRSNADMEWLGGQEYYQKLVWAMYGVTPDELGFTENSNRSTGQTQSRVFLRRAVKPYTQLLETKITEDILAEFYADGMPEVELKFKFDESELQKEEHIEQREDIKLSIITINEARLARGLEPVEWGDQPLRQVGIQPISGGDAIYEPTPSAPRNVPAIRTDGILTDADEEAILDRDLTGGLMRSWNPSPILKQLESMEIAEEGSEWEDWTPYYDFLDKYWDLIDEAVMKEFDKIVLKKTPKQDLNDFTFRIMSVLSTVGLKSQVRKYMNKSYNLGVENAEKTVGVQVGTSNQDRALIDVYTEQQIDGYVLFSGQRWDGIKGVNNKLAIDIGNTVGKLWDQGKSIEDIRKAVEDKLKTTTNHARMIARTESNRIANQAAYNTYVKSGVDGKIEWDASLDNRTSDICIALDGTQVNPGDFFTTIDGQKIQSPPAHVNCRSRVKFIPGE